MKWNIGTKIAGLGILLVVVTVAATAWTSYEETKALLIKQRRLDLAAQLRLDADRLEAAIDQLKNQVETMAQERRSRSTLKPELRMEQVKNVSEDIMRPRIAD